MFFLSILILLIACAIQFHFDPNDLGNGGGMLAMMINIAAAYVSVCISDKYMTEESNKPAKRYSIAIVAFFIFIILINSNPDNISINITGVIGLIVGTIFGIRAMPKDRITQIIEFAEDNPDKFDVFLYENASQWTTSKYVPYDPNKEVMNQYYGITINRSITLKYIGTKNHINAMDDIIDFSKSNTYSRLDHILDLKEACIKKLSSLHDTPINIGTDINPTYVKIDYDWRKFKYGVPVSTINNKPSPILDGKKHSIIEYHRLAIRLIDESDSYHAYLRSIAKEMNMKFK